MSETGEIELSEEPASPFAAALEMHGKSRPEQIAAFMEMCEKGEPLPPDGIPSEDLH